MWSNFYSQMVNGENIQTHSSINILVFNQKQSEEEDFRERQCVNILTVFLPQKNKKKVRKTNLSIFNVFFNFLLYICHVKQIFKLWEQLSVSVF